MRARAVAVLLGVVVAACANEPSPPVVRASEASETPTVSASPTVDLTEARLIDLRATDSFDEFAEHERAAQADGARLAWENFAPIVDGERVEWSNKAELWDSIAPKIRDEALLLGPEHREPLWDTRNAIPNSVTLAWNNEDTRGRGDFVEFVATLDTRTGTEQRYWGVLVHTDGAGRGTVVATMPGFALAERSFTTYAAAHEAATHREWEWIQRHEEAA